jgi:hypothetical protein
MTLNLLLSHTPEEVKHLLDRSFASFQQRKEETFLHRRWGDLIDSLEAALPAGKCDTGDPYEVMEWIAKRGELKRRARSASRKSNPCSLQRTPNPMGKEEKGKQKTCSERLPCEDCEHSVLCHADKRSEVTGLLRALRSLGGHGSEMQSGPLAELQTPPEVFEGHRLCGPGGPFDRGR